MEDPARGDGAATELLATAGFQAADAACLDSDRLEDWPGFVLERCRYRIATADNHRRGPPAGVVRADSRGILADRVSALREANVDERQAYRHILGLRAVEALPDAGSAARSPSRWRVMRGGTTALFATGRCLDLWHRGEGGALKLAEKIVVCDFAWVDTLLAIPL